MYHSIGHQWWRLEQSLRRRGEERQREEITESKLISKREGRERRKTRHSFTLPDLKWGVQRSLRCMKVQSHGGADNLNRRLETERWRSEEGIEEYREKMKESTNTKRARMGCSAVPKLLS
ncbi:hypothetical protein F2Q68_00020558 [Brassica cretica]|uniref:Uncharacterized protein n=1 Tax=Brassica cretica TaxID=69181 RepID=A0A8S9FPN1_BRACR|nr:hypothetical protein F2Q68_00020558 [Brassica cretica]